MFSFTKYQIDLNEDSKDGWVAVIYSLRSNNNENMIQVQVHSSSMDSYVNKKSAQISLSGKITTQVFPILHHEVLTHERTFHGSIWGL